MLWYAVLIVQTTQSNWVNHWGCDLAINFCFLPWHFSDTGRRSCNDKISLSIHNCIKTVFIKTKLCLINNESTKSAPCLEDALSICYFCQTLFISFDIFTVSLFSGQLLQDWKSRYQCFSVSYRSCGVVVNSRFHRIAKSTKRCLCDTEMGYLLD